MERLSDSSGNSARRSSTGFNGSHASLDSDNPMHLKLSDSRLANIKSPVYLKLEAMIGTLDKFRSEMDGNRVPRFEVTYLKKKRKENEKMLRD